MSEPSRGGKSSDRGRSGRAHGGRPYRPSAGPRTGTKASGSERRPPAKAPSRLRPSESEEEVYLRWTVHLAKQYRRRTLWVTLGMAAVAALFLLIGLGLQWAAVAVLIITGSISAWVFPISYELSNRGVRMRNLLFREEKSWLRFTDYVVHPDSVQILFDQRSIRGRVLKGLMIYFGPGNRDAILEIVRENILTPEQLARLVEDEEGQDEEATPGTFVAGPAKRKKEFNP